MARKRYSAEQIIDHLRQAEILISEGKTIGEAARQLSISEQTYYRWRREYGGMEVDQARRLKELDLENQRLKRLVAGPVQGRFKWLSQHLNSEELRWDRGSESERLTVHVGRRCSRPVDRLGGGASTNSDSGTRSVAGCRVRKPPRWLDCRLRLEAVGSVKEVGCQRSVQLHGRVAICRLASGRKSRSCMRRMPAFGRSLVGWVVRRQRSRGNWAATPQLVVEASRIGPRPHSGTPTIAPDGRSWPNLQRTRH